MGQLLPSNGVSISELLLCRASSKNRLFGEESTYKPVDVVDRDALPVEDEVADRPPHMSEQEYRAHVAGGKTMTILSREDRGYCAIEHSSVYGAAIVVPQIARSGYLLYMISTEEAVTNKFAGQMHLCDFGSSLEKCPGQSDCIGPGGTEYTPRRLYSFVDWSTRTFVRDAFLALFPERRQEILDRMDPGEYGMESYYCRMICIYVFILALWGDVAGTIEMAQLVYHVPTANEPWLSYDVPDWASKDHIKSVHNWTELDLVNFKIAGMSMRWKVINVGVVLFPKLFIWRKCLTVGVTFLMETASISNLIVNAMALTFVLGLDEMICDILMSPTTRHILDKIERFPLFVSSDEEENDSMKDAFEKHGRDRMWSFATLRFYDLLLPKRFFIVLIITALALMEYYHTFCINDEKLGRVSHSVHEPISAILSIGTFIAPSIWPQSEHADALWEMPGLSET